MDVLKVVLYLTEELLAESDEVVGPAVLAMVRSEHEAAKKTRQTVSTAKPDGQFSDVQLGAFKYSSRLVRATADLLRRRK